MHIFCYICGYEGEFCHFFVAVWLAILNNKLVFNTLQVIKCPCIVIRLRIEISLSWFVNVKAQRCAHRFYMFINR